MDKAEGKLNERRSTKSFILHLSLQTNSLLMPVRMVPSSTGFFRVTNVSAAEC